MKHDTTRTSPGLRMHLFPAKISMYTRYRTPMVPRVQHLYARGSDCRTALMHASSLQCSIRPIETTASSSLLYQHNPTALSELGLT